MTKGQPVFTGKTKIITMEMCVGVFFFTALLILIYYTALVRGDDIFSGGKRYNARISFSDISSLAENDKVYLRGMPVGKVKLFTLDDRNESVIVTVTFDRPVIFHKGYSIAVRNSSLLGGKHIYIDAGNPASPKIPEGTVLTGTGSADILHQMSELIASLQDDEKKFREKFIDSDALQGIDDAGKALRDMADSLKSGKGTLGKLLNDDKLYNDTVGALAKMDKAADNISAVFADIKDGRGTLGKLAKDDSVYNDLKAAVADIRAVTGKLTDNTGSLGKIMNDEGKLYESVLSTVESAKVISVQLSEGKGTFGRLLFDEDLYRDTKETVSQLKGAVEDFREQAPIATFGSMIFSAL